MEGVLPYNVVIKSPESMASSSAAAAEVVEEKEFVGLKDGEPGEDNEQVEEEGEEQEQHELELGLTLGKKNAVSRGTTVATPWPPAAQRCRILTAKDFPSLLSRASPRSSSTSSVSSSSGTSGGAAAGIKRSAAESAFPERQAGASPHYPIQGVVGWPPIRAFRMNSLFNHAKETISDTDDMAAFQKADYNSIRNEENGHIEAGNGSKDMVRKGRTTGNSHFVKVNMDGDPIGRKVDLSVHHSYEALAITLEVMFHKLAMSLLSASIYGTKTSKLLDGSSDFALTYKDRDGDWMLVGDVPWGMFLGTVRRLRIMKTTEANGIASRFQSPILTSGLMQSLPA